MTPSILYIHTLLAVIWGHAPVYQEHWRSWGNFMGVSPMKAKSWFEKGTIPAGSLQALVDRLGDDLNGSSFLSKSLSIRNTGEDPMLHFLKVQRAFQKWLEDEAKLVITNDNKRSVCFGSVNDLYSDFVAQHLHNTL